MSSPLGEAAAEAAATAGPHAEPAGAEQTHAPAAWDRLVRALSRELPRGLERARASRRRLRRLR